MQASGAAPNRRGISRPLPGLALAVAVAVPASVLGRWVPTVGGPVFGIGVGVVVGALLRRGGPPGGVGRLDPGLAVAGRQVLQWAVVVLGAGLPLQRVLGTGAASLPVLCGTLAVALVGAWWLGRALGVDGETGLLIGVGTGVCGASAIAAVSTVVDAARARVAYAMGTIVAFNVAAVIVFPPLGHAWGLSPEGFGLWSGTAINDTSSVVAAASGYGAEAGAEAVMVKMTRTLMIVPICAVLLLWSARRHRAGHGVGSGGGTERGGAGSGGTERGGTGSGGTERGGAGSGGTERGGGPGQGGTERGAVDRGGRVGAARRVRGAFPLVVPGFLAASAVATLGLVPGSWLPALSTLSGFLITVALAGIGLSLRLSQLRAAGPRPLLLGGALWVAVSLSALGLQALTGRW